MAKTGLECCLFVFVMVVPGIVDPENTMAMCEISKKHSVSVGM
jgi:hypothetical protein